MCTSALPNRLPAHPCLVQLSRRRTATSAPRNPWARIPVLPLLHGTPPPLAASERRFGSRGARIDGSRGRSGGCGHQIGGGGGRIPRWWSSNQRRRRSAVLQSAAAEPKSTAVRRPTRARELASNLARTGLSFCSPSCCTASTLFVAGRIRSPGWTFAGLDTYLLRIGILFYLFFCRYSMDTCPPRIRCVSISDTYPIRDTPPPWRIGVT